MIEGQRPYIDGRFRLSKITGDLRKSRSIAGDGRRSLASVAHLGRCAMAILAMVAIVDRRQNTYGKLA